MSVEQAFGILKARFRCLEKTGRDFHYSLNKVCQIMVASSMPHNLALRQNIRIITENEECEELPGKDLEMANEDDSGEGEGIDFNQDVIDHIFTCVYVSGIVDCYYKSNETIRMDPELQAWVSEIYTEGFLGRKSSGVPSSLQNRAELVKYLNMVIFTCSAQHAAVNSGQFDFTSWIPNSPCTMRQPPPKTKGTATLESILETLPSVGVTANIMTTVRVLSEEPGDRRPLGTFPDERFTEEEPKRCIKAFQERLSQISAEIESRNESLPLKYNYLNPKVIENSVSV